MATALHPLPSPTPSAAIPATHIPLAPGLPIAVGWQCQSWSYPCGAGAAAALCLLLTWLQVPGEGWHWVTLVFI